MGNGGGMNRRMNGIGRKRHEWKRMLTAACVFALSLGLFGCAQANTGEERPHLTLGAAEDGRFFTLAGYAAASALNESGPGVVVETVLSKGAFLNADNVDNGTWDLAMIPADIALAAYGGTGSFSGTPKEHLRVLAAFYVEPSLWIAREDSGLSYVHDLLGKSVVTGSPASMTWRVSQDVSHVLGMDMENTELWEYGVSEGAQGLLEGWADAAHLFSDGPAVGWRSLSEQVPLTFLSYTQEELQAVLAQNAAYEPVSLAAGTYSWQTEDYETFGMKVLLCASDQMSDQMAYGIAETLHVRPETCLNDGSFRQRMESLGLSEADLSFLTLLKDDAFISSGLPIPLHSGAEAYYRETGVLN